MVDDIVLVSAPIAVAVVDTGVDTFMEGIRTVPGFNVSGDGPVEDTGDRAGHGSEVARTIIAHAPEAQILPVKLMGDHGYLRRPEYIETAFDWIVANHADRRIRVVCAAFADFSRCTADVDFRGSPLQRAIAQLRDRGVVTVAPAGNRFTSGLDSGAEGMAWPAILREVVSVGALDAASDEPCIDPRSQRLARLPERACWTTVFAFPGPPGGASGAAAVVAGRLAATSVNSATVAEQIRLLLRSACILEDDDGRRWPALIRPSGGVNCSKGRQARRTVNDDFGDAKY